MGIEAVLFQIAGPTIRVHGQPVSALPCGQGVVVSDASATGPPAEVKFQAQSAELMFADPRDAMRTLFIFVDGINVAMLTARGPLKVVVPLDARRHHKIVTGSAINGEATSASAACTGLNS